MKLVFLFLSMLTLNRCQSNYVTRAYELFSKAHLSVFTDLTEIILERALKASFKKHGPFYELLGSAAFKKFPSFNMPEISLLSPMKNRHCEPCKHLGYQA